MSRSLFANFAAVFAFAFCLILISGCEDPSGSGQNKNSRPVLTIDEMRVQAPSMPRGNLIKMFGKPDYEEEVDMFTTRLLYDKIAKDPKTGELKNVRFTLKNQVVESVEFL